VKRASDVLLGVSGLLLTLPIVLVAASAIRLTMGAPVLFAHQRPGLGGALFTVYKLRTMKDSEDAEGRVLAPFERVTRLGRFLRRTSIDELPQLWNVVRGEMSLVGPRPLLTSYLQHYDAVQMRRHDVRPGITGWSQIHRRQATSWKQKLELDIWYVDHWSNTLDAYILLRSVWEVVCSGVARTDPCMNSLSRTTSEELAFRGNAGPSSSMHD
jgi:sugar transferase EpsL